MTRLITLVSLLMVTVPAMAAPIDCVVKYQPPAQYTHMVAPAHKLVGLPLAQLQAMYAQLSGTPRDPRPYCGTFGFVDPRGTVPVIYFANDVTLSCQAQVRSHELAHVKGWPAGHPGGTLQKGQCS